MPPKGDLLLEEGGCGGGSGDLPDDLLDEVPKRYNEADLRLEVCTGTAELEGVADFGLSAARDTSLTLARDELDRVLRLLFVRNKLSRSDLKPVSTVSVDCEVAPLELLADRC